MATTLVGVRGRLTGVRFPVAGETLTLGRSDTNDVVLTDPSASRVHAEVRREGDEYVLRDRGSGNGTWVNGTPVTRQRLRPGDEITIGDETFRFEVAEPAAADSPTVLAASPVAEPILRVTVAGGGPVGLSLALLLDHLMGSRVAVTVYDGRWAERDGRIVWLNPEQGNNRRLQVVTVQSRQFRKLPPEVQDRLFRPGSYTEMWPSGPDSIEGYGPRNIRIAFIEDELLALVNEKDRIRLIPRPFDAEELHPELVRQHVLAICEGGRSATREHFADRFGAADETLYGLDGEQVHDLVLGLRVKSALPDPMAVLLTVSQNRFLLNSLRGEGFLNMRLTDQEESEAVGINMARQVFTACVQSRPCILERQPDGGFMCETHHTFFLPALLKGSALWTRIQDGLRLFGVAEGDLTAITGFRLDMVQRPRFTAQLFPATRTTPGTFGFLLGDTANAIHFWPGRGLNSGLASATSLARCLAAGWTGAPLRDAGFTRHEAVMAMLQYRHKTRAFRQMVTHDATGDPHAIKDLIAQGITEGEQGACDPAADLRVLMERLQVNRGRLEGRLSGLPDDETLRAHLEQLSGSLLHTLAVSEPWDTVTVGGEEVDVDWLLPAPEPAEPLPEPRSAPETAARGWARAGSP